MPFTQDELDQLGAFIDQRVNAAKFGGPTVQVAPRDLVYLGESQYVSESTGKVYRKGGQGRLIMLGDIPAPL